MLLTLVVGVATLWLAATGQLILYIHPRYVVFTVIMIAIGMVLSVGVLALSPARERDDHDHDHDHEAGAHDGPDHGAGPLRPRRPRRGRAATRGILVGAGAVVTVAIAVALVALPPATLTSATAGQRDVNSSTAALDRTSVEDATGASDETYASFSILDWAGLLRQTTDLSFYQGKTADLVGFVVPAGDDPDVFYVSRFIITCCAVDAQPVGVPVYLPDWQETVEADDWIDVSGGFEANRSGSSSDPIALVPDALEKVGQPSDPYLY